MSSDQALFIRLRTAGSRVLTSTHHSPLSIPTATQHHDSPCHLRIVLQILKTPAQRATSTWILFLLSFLSFSYSFALLCDTSESLLLSYYDSRPEGPCPSRHLRCPGNVSVCNISLQFSTSSLLVLPWLLNPSCTTESSRAPLSGPGRELGWESEVLAPPCWIGL